MVDPDMLFTLPAAGLADRGPKEYEVPDAPQRWYCFPQSHSGTANTRGVAVKGQISRQLSAQSEASDKGPLFKVLGGGGT